MKHSGSAGILPAGGDVLSFMKCRLEAGAPGKVRQNARTDQAFVSSGASGGLDGGFCSGGGAWMTGTG
jgi:hypothetical protein